MTMDAIWVCHVDFGDLDVHTFQCVFTIHEMKGTSFVHQGGWDLTYM
jgi:hypothetical protein